MAEAVEDDLQPFKLIFRLDRLDGCSTDHWKIKAIDWAAALEVAMEAEIAHSITLLSIERDW